MSTKFKGTVQVDGSLRLTGRTGQRAAATDASGNIVESSVTSTELDRLSGVTSSIQTQLDAKIAATEKGAANGVATLDAGGVIPSSQLPALAISDTFVVSSEAAQLALTAEVGDVAVRTDISKTFILRLAGPSTLSNWQEMLQPAAPVQSVNGATGVVSLDSDDIGEGATNLYFTNERAQDAVGTMLTDTATIDLSYNDASAQITADVINNSINGTKIRLQNAEALRARNAADNGDVQVAVVIGTDELFIGGASNAGVSVVAGGAVTVEAQSGDVNLRPSGVVSVGTSGNEKRITNVATPTDNTDAATKAYVDSAVSVPTGDILPTDFAIVNNQTSAANVTGLSFASGLKGFRALVSVSIDATTDLVETFELLGVQRSAGWEMAVTSTGDDSGVILSITTGGQVQYTSSNYSGFVSGELTFRAQSV